MDAELAAQKRRPKHQAVSQYGVLRSESAWFVAELPLTADGLPPGVGGNNRNPTALLTMRTIILSKRLLATFVSLTLMLGSIPTSSAALSDGLVSYWPLDTVQGTKTPDLVSGYDMTLNNLTDADLVTGKVGKTFAFSNAKKTILTRVHSAGEQLPINQHASFTISFWAKVNGTGQNDLRVFSEGNTANSDPLFNIGTHNTGADNTLDLFIRQSGWTAVNHLHTTAEAFDDQWHHVVFVQNNLARAIYIDGKKDDLVIADKPAGTFNVNNTSIGGILRASAGSLVTGLIDDVALWKRALTETEITTVSTAGLKSLFSPVANDLVSHWPLDEVQGTKTPDLVSGYDMTLNNLTAADLVAGKVGKTFAFSNAKQTILTRVHSAGEQLPINQHASFTVSFWAKVNGTGQNDLRVFSEGNTANSDPLFNIGTHNTGADGTLDLFIRQSGWTAVNHLHTTAEAFDDQWHHVVFVQNNLARAIYIDGKKDDLVIADKPAGTFNVNNTSIGGILRASAGSLVTGLIDDVALWKRALAEEEITDVMANGVPAVVTQKAPLDVRTFTADYPVVVQGDKVVLRWEASKDATLSISPGVGDVTAKTIVGVGSAEVTVNQTTAFILTAARAGETKTAQTTVRTIANVAPNWRLIENFDSLTAGRIAGLGYWSNPEGTFSVVDLGVNKVLGYTDGNALAALPLNSLALNEGQKATLFFRIFVSTNDPVSTLGATFGLTERAIRFNGDFNGNVGPYVRVERLGEGATIDLLAHNGVGATYDPLLDAIQPGSAYRVWIDADNRPFDVQGGVQNGGDHFSVHLQKEGAASRTTIFQDYVADRDAANIDPFFGAPGTSLTHLFFSAIGATQGTNNVMFDDFYISTGGFKDTVPTPVSSFVKVETPKEIKITSSAFDAVSKAFTLTWSSATAAKYTVRRAENITGPWTDVASNLAGAGATTSYTDRPVSGAAAFYQIRFVP
jgi:hypothetical protein